MRLRRSCSLTDIEGGIPDPNGVDGEFEILGRFRSDALDLNTGTMRIRDGIEAPFESVPRSSGGTSFVHDGPPRFAFGVDGYGKTICRTGNQAEARGVDAPAGRSTRNDVPRSVQTNEKLSRVGLIEENLFGASEKSGE